MRRELLLTMVILSSCAFEVPAEEFDETSADADVGRAVESLNAHIGYDAECTPFAIAHWERGAFYSRVIAASQAFRQCLTNTLNAEYTPAPGDPNASEPHSVRVNLAVGMYHNVNNHVAVDCQTDVDYVTGVFGTYGEYSTRYFGLGIESGVFGGYHESASAWSVYDDPGNEYQPWNWRAGDTIHEFAHTHGYNHVTGNRGVPYMADSCAAELVQQSFDLCPDASVGGCGSDQLYLLAAWTGTDSTVQTSGNCVCYTDPRVLVSFRHTANNRRFTMMGGGGSDIRTDQTTALGSWQTFTVVSNRRGSADPAVANYANWWDYDDVQIRAYNDFFVGTGFWANSTAPPLFLRVTLGGSPPVRPLANGDVVSLYALDPILGGRWASDNGTRLTTVSSAGTPGTNERFAMDIYRRDTIVYLRTAHDRFVNATGAPDRLLFNQTLPSTLTSYTNNASTTASKRASAFRLIDWNGGPLMHGDSVSFEQLRDSGWRYWSTTGSGTGQVWLGNSVGNNERFTIYRVAGSTATPIGHDTEVYLMSAQSYYLTAWPNDATGQLKIVNNGTWAGPWQRFRLRMVEQHDRNRPTW